MAIRILTEACREMAARYPETSAGKSLYSMSLTAVRNNKVRVTKVGRYFVVDDDDLPKLAAALGLTSREPVGKGKAA